jgi:acetyl esterase
MFVFQITNAVANSVPIRIYSPISRVSEPHPVMFYYHGGAYCFGKLDMYDTLLTRFAEELAIVVISVGYRLAPENAYPIPIEDCFAGTFHVLNNTQEFNLNVNFNKIIFSGDSAGRQTGWFEMAVCIQCELFVF